MDIMVLPDGRTSGALDGCTIRRVPDGIDEEALDDLIASDGGEIVARLNQPGAAGIPAEAELCRADRKRSWPAWVWLADVRTEGPPDIEVLFPHEEAAARSIAPRETYFSEAAVRPLRETLEGFAAADRLEKRLALAAEHALARFRAMTGERRRRG